MSNIYFNKKLHSYTTEFEVPFISSTQLKSEYINKFSDKEKQIAAYCEKAGRNPRHPKYLKYKGKRQAQILAEWAKAKKDGIDNGNEKHDYLEDSIKSSTGFYEVFPSRYSNNTSPLVKLYTVDDIIKNITNGISFGVLNIDDFIRIGVRDKYPEIFSVITKFADEGWTIYSEACVYNMDYLISGLIDLLLIRGNKFIILDWKTNKNTVRFESGYWDSDHLGNYTYLYNDNVFKYPLHHLPHSTGNEFALQVSIYAWLVEQFGLEHVLSVIFHIPKDIYTKEDCKGNSALIGKNKVNIIPIPYLKNEAESMIFHYRSKSQKTFSYGN